MSLRSSLSCALICLAALAGSLEAGDFPVKIVSARIGLPAAAREDGSTVTPIAKFASWAPVYVEVELSAPVEGGAELVIEAIDPDEINTSLAVPVNLSGAEVGSRISAAGRGAIGYIRPAGVGEVTITIRRAGSGPALSDPFRLQSVRPRDPLAYVVLSLGAGFQQFELPKAVGNNETNTALRGGRVELAELLDVDNLPDRWFGYETVDLVVLNTSPGHEQFLSRLFGETASPNHRAKREALLEWVRRGGRILISVGANASLAAKLPSLQEILPFRVNPSSPSRLTQSLVLSWNEGESTRTRTKTGALVVKSGQFPVADLSPGPSTAARVLIPTRDRLKSLNDVIAAQAPYGLGRVTILGFDLDRAPFTSLPERPEFWDWVLREGGANRASVGSDGKPRPGEYGPTEEEDEFAVALRTHNDTFAEVPVVSFGWIALLIVLYIVLIGPVEYFFLRRIIGRLELTWVTFPIIVLSVSLAAYFTADSLKGRELRINKVDVVDVDPVTQRVYGTTWFTLFSPRIETYTLGVTPAESWCADDEHSNITWSGAPRGGRANLLRRGYRYHEGEDGLENVPIQVWSTKAFVANWSGRMSSAASGSKMDSKLFESDLHHPPADPAAVIGSFVSRLPSPLLSDCVLFHAGQAYPLPGGTIRPGERVRVVLEKGFPASQWLQRESRLEEVLQRVPSYADRPGAARVPLQSAEAANTAAFDDTFPFWGGLFHESSLSYAEGVIPRNASLRRLDQSWRLDPSNVGEVMLVGRMATPSGPAEETLAGPNSPSRLWIAGVPGTGPRTPVPGTGRQETWVRVYLPVR